MTVYNWLASFQIGETRSIPSNCTAHDLIYEAAARFGFTLIERGGSLTRICPRCER